MKWLIVFFRVFFFFYNLNIESLLLYSSPVHTLTICKSKVSVQTLRRKFFHYTFNTMSLISAQLVLNFPCRLESLRSIFSHRCKLFGL